MHSKTFPCWAIALVLTACASAAAEEANPQVTRVLDAYYKAVDEAEAEYAELMRKAEAEQTEALAKASQRAITGLKRYISTRSSLEQQTQIYTHILRIDREHAEAVAFFTEAGTLEEVLAELDQPQSVNLLGAIMEEKQSPQIDKQIGSLKNLKITSAGYADGNNASIAVGDTVLLDRSGHAGRGINVVAISAAGQELWARTYDTYARPEAAPKFIEDVGQLPRDTIVVIAACDDATRSWSPEGDEVLRALGADAGLSAAGFRGAYILIGKVWAGPGKGYELIGKSGAGGLHYPPQ